MASVEIDSAAWTGRTFRLRNIFHLRLYRLPFVYIAAYRQPELARYPNAEGELMKGVGLFWGFNGSYQAREVAIVWGRRHIVLFRKLRREMKI